MATHSSSRGVCYNACTFGNRYRSIQALQKLNDKAHIKDTLQDIYTDLTNLAESENNSSEALISADDEIRILKADLDRARFPLETVLQDDRYTDVSEAGYRIEDSFHDVERDLLTVKRYLQSFHHHTRQVDPLYAQVEGSLQELAKRLKDPAVRRKLQQAATLVNAAYSLHEEAVDASSQAQRNSGEIERNAQIGFPYIYQIENDAPGQDVSPAGRSLERLYLEMDDATYNAQFNLRDAEGDNQQATSKLAGAADVIKQLLG